VQVNLHGDDPCWGQLLDAKMKGVLKVEMKGVLKRRMVVQ
jgi:hypothetical protein